MPTTLFLDVLLKKQFIETFYLMVTYNIDPNEIEPNTGKTPLYFAKSKLLRNSECW